MTHITWLTGEKRLAPIVYEVKADRIAGIPWRYWLIGPYLRMGPFYRKREAYSMKAFAESL